MTGSDQRQVDVAKYLPRLRDPADGASLVLSEDGRLRGLQSGLVYDFVGPFPDLRPGQGAAHGAFPATIHARARDHYDDKRCSNDIALDNVPPEPRS